MLLCWYQIHVLYISWILLTSTVYYVVLIFKFQYMYFYQSMWFLNFIKNYIYQRMINGGFLFFSLNITTTFENYCVIMIQWIQSRLYVNFSFFFTALLRKYNQVVQRYFVQYLAGYDAVLLNQLIQVLSAECTVLSNCVY